jgi:hypothetical protein
MTERKVPVVNRPPRMWILVGVFAWFLGLAYLVASSNLPTRAPGLVPLFVALVATSLVYGSAMGAAARALQIGRRSGSPGAVWAGAASLVALPLAAGAWFVPAVVRGVFEFQLGDGLATTPSLTGLGLALALAGVAVAWARSLPLGGRSLPMAPWLAGILTAAIMAYLSLGPGIDPAAIPWAVAHALLTGIGGAATAFGLGAGVRWLTSVAMTAVVALPVAIASFFHLAWYSALAGIDIDYGWAPLLPYTVAGAAVTALAAIAAAAGMGRHRRERAPRDAGTGDTKVST